MKVSILFFAVFLVETGALHGQTTTICIPYGDSILADGIISPGEWDDSDSITIELSAIQDVTVYYKYDSLNFFLAYLNNLESAIRFPEVVIDVNNDKSTGWLTDDWWFHVSATDCESNGSPNVYTDCLAIQPDWKGVPNMSAGAPYTDTVEMIIPFSKTGITLGINDTIGIAFDVTNTSTVWNMWPAGALQGNPSTWANAVFCGTSLLSLPAISTRNSYKIFPNPADMFVLITCSSGQNISEVYVSDMATLRRQAIDFDSLPNGDVMISTMELPAGNYLLEIVANEQTEVRKVLVLH